MKISDLIFDFLDAITDSFSKLLSLIARFFVFLYHRVLEKPLKIVFNAIDAFQVKYLGKGKLKNQVLVKYIVKELLLYFLVAFLFS